MEILGCLGLLAVAVAISIVSPLLYAIGGGFVGWVLTNLFSFAGQWVVTGANDIGLKITLDQLPYIGTFLGFVGAFFKSTHNSSSK